MALFESCDRIAQGITEALGEILNAHPINEWTSEPDADYEYGVGYIDETLYHRRFTADELRGFGVPLDPGEVRDVEIWIGPLADETDYHGFNFHR